MKNLVFFLVVFFTLLFTYLGTMGFFAYEQSLRHSKAVRLCQVEGDPQLCKETVQ